MVLTVASYYQEFIITMDIMDRNVWVGSDNLLFGREFGALLEFEVSDSS